MSEEKKSRPSFSVASRWRIGFDVVLRTALVLAVVLMANYLGAKYSHRFFLNPQTSAQLSSRSVTVLHSLTNAVNVTLYFDRKDEFYPDILALLNEYRAANPKISLHTVDYVRDAGEAEKIKQQYHQYFSALSDKNLIIFDCGGHVKIVPGDALMQYALEQVPNPKEREFRRKPVAFAGEKIFTSMLLALASPQALKAYFLQGHGEPSLTGTGNFDYAKFAGTLQQNYVTVSELQLLGPAGVPLDCNLLIIAAPTAPLTETELQKIEKYLQEGGRLFALFNYASVRQPTGLEAILERWNVKVLADVVQDPDSAANNGQDLIVREFNKHPVVNSLSQLSLQLVLPRPVLKMNPAGAAANAPTVDELIATSANATLAGDRTVPPRNYPLACAVEQKPVAGVVTARGTTRIIVVGDSIFLGNYYIEGGGNRDFLNSAVNWLLDRPQLLAGIDPRPVTEFRLLLTQQQQRQLRWLLLGALPGALLALGGLVWFIRRK